MYAVSDEFLVSVKNSGLRKTVVDVYYGSTTPIAANVPVTECTISADRTADIRRAGTITVSSYDVSSAIFLPVGTEIAIRSGVVFPDGTEELVPMGVFIVETNSVQDGIGKTISMSFNDRGKALTDLPSLFPQTFQLAGKLASELIIHYSDYAFIGKWYTPTIFQDASLPDYKIPGGFLLEGTHWEIIQKLAEGMGGEAFFNTDGDLVIQPVPSISSSTSVGDTVLTIGAGEGGALIEANRTRSRSDTYNIVAFYGAQTAAGAQARAYIYDSNPASPTYYWGNFGKKSIRFDNEMLITNAQCLSAATAKLADLTGLSRNVSFGMLFNPALDPGDIVLFDFLTATSEIHMIDSLAFDLTSGAMSGQTRTVQFVT